MHVIQDFGDGTIMWPVTSEKEGKVDLGWGRVFSVYILFGGESREGCSVFS